MRYACFDISLANISINCPVCSNQLQLTSFHQESIQQGLLTLVAEGICFSCNDREGKLGRYRTVRYQQKGGMIHLPAPKPLPIIGEVSEEELRRRLRTGDYEKV